MSFIWGDWALTRDQKVVQIRGADGYRVGRVALHDVYGNFIGRESRKNLIPLRFDHFHSEKEKQDAATILSEMADLYKELLEDAG